MNEIIYGNVLEVEGMIAHQVNCMNAFGSGIAGQMANKWPSTKQTYHDYPHKKLGEICYAFPTPNVIVCHCFSQESFGNSAETGGVYTDYPAVQACMDELTYVLEGMRELDPHINLFIPYGYGCGLAGGDWSVVSKIIEKHAPAAILVKLKHG
jgi:hypothetical protein